MNPELEFVVNGSCGTGGFVNFWIYEFDGTDTIPMPYEYPEKPDGSEDDPCMTGSITVANERMYIIPVHHLGGSASTSPPRCQVIWKSGQFKVIPESTSPLPFGTVDITYWRQDNQVSFFENGSPIKSVELYIGQLIQFTHDEIKDPEPCSGEIRLADDLLLDFTGRFGVIRANKAGSASISINCGLDNIEGSIMAHIVSAK